MKKPMIRVLSFALALLIGAGSFLLLGREAGLDLAEAADSSTYKNELWLMADYEYALVKGTKKKIREDGAAAPYLFMGDTMTCYIPLSALCLFTGATFSLGKDEKAVTVTLSGGAQKQMTVGELEWSGGEFLLPPVLKDGEVYLSNLSAKSVFSLQGFTDLDIGLIVFGTKSLNYNSSYSSLSVRIETLRHLLFETVTADGIYRDIVNAVGINTHPRLMVTQERFDELRENYLYFTDPDHLEEAAEDRLFALVSRFVTQANSSFKNYFVETTDEEGNPTGYDWKSEDVVVSLRHPYYLYDENGNRLVGKTSYTGPDGVTTTLSELYGKSNLTGDGYDEGGRLNQSGTTAAHLLNLAFGWQITRDEKYAYAFYHLAKELGKWEHWGEGHFLNCADASAPYALGLDWIWHAYDDEPAKRDEMAKILYDFGITPGWYSVKNNSSGMHLSARAGGGWKTTNRTNNWNTVDCSGMTMAALVLIEYPEYKERSGEVMTALMNLLYKCFIQYAPDGSYIESPGYWGYGTNTYMRMLACLRTATGKTYGYLDTVGLRQSYFFANNICDSSYVVWNYHDGGRSRVDGSTFYMASALFGDPDIAHHRDLYLDLYPTGSALYDAIFYDPSLSEGASEGGVLDAKFKSIETATMRSSWETGAIFTGLHVGPNVVTHGDIDCGNFYLEMGGVLWFGDPGSENYNIGNYFSNSYRYYFYRKTLEAHNAIIIKPQSGDRSSNIYNYGQTYNSMTQNYAKIDDFYSGEEGAYAVSDMTVQYGSTCSSAKRGVMLTDSRSVVVVQDEIEFNTPTSLTWTAASQQTGIEIIEDGRAALIRYYKSGVATILRASLVSEDENLKFEILRSGTILPKTVTNVDHNGTAESRKYPAASAVQPRLVINADNVTSFNVAVVFEIIRVDGTRMPTVGYEYQPMAEWQPKSDEWLIQANEDIRYPEQIHYDYQPSDLVFILRDIERANGDIGKLTEIIRRHPAVDESIKLDDYSVAENIGTYRYWRNYVNGYLRDLNKTYSALFGSSLYELKAE